MIVVRKFFYYANGARPSPPFALFVRFCPKRASSYTRTIVRRTKIVKKQTVRTNRNRKIRQYIRSAWKSGVVTVPFFETVATGTMASRVYYLRTKKGKRRVLFSRVSYLIDPRIFSDQTKPQTCTPNRC